MFYMTSKDGLGDFPQSTLEGPRSVYDFLIDIYSPNNLWNVRLLSPACAPLRAGVIRQPMTPSLDPHRQRSKVVGVSAPQLSVWLFSLNACDKSHICSPPPPQYFHSRRGPYDCKTGEGVLGEGGSTSSAQLHSWIPAFHHHPHLCGCQGPSE